MMTTTKKSQVFKAKGGIMETLHKGFLDLRKLGPVSMRRSSEILFNEIEQKFYIKFLEPELEYLNNMMTEVLFDTYELAVEREIKVINRARLEGIL
jgi:hypothetical protein